MASGQKAVVVIVLAVVMKGFIGYGANFEEQETVKTTYTPIGNLDALMSANSGQVMSSEVFNSPYNVTAWEGATIQLTTNANQYIISPSISGWDTTNGTYDFNDHGATRYVSLADSITDKFPTYVNDVVLDVNLDYLTYSSTGDRFGPVVGGYTTVAKYSPGSAGAHCYLEYYLNNVKVNDYSDYTSTGVTTAIYFMNLSEIVSGQIVDGTRVSVSGNVQLTSQLSLTREITSSSNVTYFYNCKVFINAQTIDFDYLQYDAPTQTWYAYKNGIKGVGSQTFAFLYQTSDANSHSISWTKQVPQYTPAVYADPTKFVSVAGTGTWSNNAQNNTLINTQVSFLWQGVGTVAVNGTGPTLNIDVVDGNYVIRTSPTEYTVIGKWQDPSVPMGNWATDTYKALHITISTDSDMVVVRGVMNLSNTREYTLANVDYIVGFYNYSGDVPNITSLAVTSPNANVYISETWILTDPSGILWGDPSLNLNDYFMDYSQSMRVLIEGVVSYGDSLIVNNLTFPVSDGSITVTIDGKTSVFAVKGLAIDFKDGHTYLTNTEGRSRTSDLGETVSYVIGGTGAWYFSSVASQISQVPSTKMVWNPGFDSDWNTMILLFVAIVIALSCVLLLMFRDDITVIDILILVISVFISIMMLVVD